MFNLLITYRTGKTEKVRASAIHGATENGGMISYEKADGVGFGKIYPDTGIVTKIEISFDKPPIVG